MERRSLPLSPTRRRAPRRPRGRGAASHWATKPHLVAQWPDKSRKMRAKSASQISTKLPANQPLLAPPPGHLKIVVSPVRVWVSPFLKMAACGLVLGRPSERFGGALEGRFCARGPFQVLNLRVVEGLVGVIVFCARPSGARFLRKAGAGDDRGALTLVVLGMRLVSDQRRACFWAGGEPSDYCARLLAI